MFTQLKSRFARRPSRADDWSALRDAGYRDVPRYYDRVHDRERADRERLGTQSMGFLR